MLYNEENDMRFASKFGSDRLISCESSLPFGGERPLLLISSDLLGLCMDLPSSDADIAPVLCECGILLDGCPRC